MQHSASTSNHILENWTYTNSGSRTGATGFVSGDVGKIAYQQSDGSYWRLTATTPTWAQIGSGGGGGGASGLYSAYLNTPPALSSWSWVNQASSTAKSEDNTSIMLSVPTSGLSWSFLTLAAPAAPYSVIALLSACGQTNSVSSAGLCLYSSSTGKALAFENLAYNAANSPWRLEELNSPTSDNMAAASAAYMVPCPYQTPTWARMRNDATTYYFDISPDGANWINLFSQAVAAWVVADHIGFGGVADLTPVNISLVSWATTNTATL